MIEVTRAVDKEFIPPDITQVDLPDSVCKALISELRRLHHKDLEILKESKEIDLRRKELLSFLEMYTRKKPPTQDFKNFF